MTSEKFIEVSLKIRESTLQIIENIVTYENKKNQLLDNEKPYVTIEDFIVVQKSLKS